MLPNGTHQRRAQAAQLLVIPQLRSNTSIALIYRLPILFLKPNSKLFESQSFPDLSINKNRKPPNSIFLRFWRVYS